MKAVVLSMGVAVGCWLIAVPSFAQGQGRGIGPSVSQLAKNGVHGQQLAAMVLRLQAAQGIGQVNAGGQNAGVGGMMGGGRGGPGMKGGPGMMGGGRGGPGMKGGRGMMGGGRGGPGMKGGRGMMGGGKGRR